MSQQRKLEGHSVARLHSCAYVRTCLRCSRQRKALREKFRT